MSPQEAQQELTELEAAAIQMKARHQLEFQPLKERAILLTRVINGDDLHDRHHAAEMRKYQEREAAISRGEDVVAASQEAARQESEESRKLAEARAAQIKQYQNARFEEAEQMSRQTRLIG